MSTQKYTPGPWSVAFYGETERPVIKHGNQSIADVRGCELDDSTSHSLANARLIAAAPDLLEALKRLIASDRDGAIANASEYLLCEAANLGADPVVREQAAAMLQARAAIARASISKAEGGK